MADLYPVFEVPKTVEELENDNDIYKPSAYFDFETGDFKVDGSGRVSEANGYEAWQQWCIKTCCTQRNAYATYTAGLGIEGEEAFAEHDRLLQQAYLERSITEALMADPHKRTISVSAFRWDWQGDEVKMTCDILGKDDKTAVISAQLRGGEQVG